MKSITRHLTDKIKIYNLTEDISGGLEYSLVAENVPCHIQPQDGNYIEDSTGMYGKSYVVFFDYRTDIQEGTHLVYQGEESYELRVVEVEAFIFTGLKKHLEARCRIFDNIKQYGS